MRERGTAELGTLLGLFPKVMTGTMATLDPHKDDGNAEGFTTRRLPERAGPVEGGRG
jgi:hypothetical protein